MTPYGVEYIQKSPHLLSYMPFDAQLELVDISLQARESTMRVLKLHLGRAQSRMKSQAHKGRIDRTYDVGDSVYVKLQPYGQLSLKDHSFQKLSAKFYSPFQIVAKVGVVTYTFALPPHSKIHLTLHISKLKKKLVSHTASLHLLVVHSNYGYVMMEPEAILARRMAPKRAGL